MTEAQEKVYLWSLISRARKLKKPMKIPDHWLKYGDISKDFRVVLNAHMDAFCDNVKGLFESDSTLYNYLRNGKWNRK